MIPSVIRRFTRVEKKEQELQEKYAVHDEYISRIQQSYRRIRELNRALETGNVVVDLIRGTYRPIEQEQDR